MLLVSWTLVVYAIYLVLTFIIADGAYEFFNSFIGYKYSLILSKIVHCVLLVLPVVLIVIHRKYGGL